MARLLPALLLTVALSLGTSVPAAAGDGVGVFHDRVTKRDPADDVKGDSSRPVDIRKVLYDHYRTGDHERLVITVRSAQRISSRVTFRWHLGTTGDFVTLVWDVGGDVTVIRDGDKSSSRGAKRSVDGRVATLTIPWARLGSPRTITNLSLLAEYAPDGLDIVGTGRNLR